MEPHTFEILPKEDAFVVNCKDKKIDCAIETIIGAKQPKIEVHHKTETKRH